MVKTNAITAGNIATARCKEDVHNRVCYGVISSLLVAQNTNRIQTLNSEILACRI